MANISIVVPTLMEAQTVGRCLQPLQPVRCRGVELIVVDGGSRDDTVTRAGRLADRVLSVEPPGRARQMNAGWRASHGERIVFLHADTRLGPHHLEALAAVPRGPGRGVWGRFDVRLSGRAASFRVIERAINVRSRLTRLATGDQAIFADRSLLEAVGGFPEIPLMEDLELSRALRRRAPCRCLRPPVVTSSRRWEREGVWRTVFLMWRLRLAWSLGADPAALAARYRHAR